MNYKTYSQVKLLKDQYKYMPFKGKITSDDLIFIYNVSSIEDVYKFVSAETISFVEECLNSEKPDDYLRDRIREDYSKMTPEEILQNLEEFFDNNVYDKEILQDIPDKFYILENTNDNAKNHLLHYMPEEDLYKYINEDGKASDSIIDAISKSKDFSVLFNSMVAIKSDFNRAKILLKSSYVEALFFIEDKYYRSQIIKQSLENSPDKTKLLDEMNKYNVYLEEIKSFKDEKSKAEYISKIEDKNMKLSLLSQVQGKENRDIIINSFEGKIDPNIKSLNELAQTMIREFFEDTLGDKFTDDKKEKLEIILNMSEVEYGVLEQNVNGIAEHFYKHITISNRHQDSLNRNLGFLIHEYEHLLSVSEYFHTKEMPVHSIEEGMADLFSDLVINHYLDKHQNIELDGKSLRIDKPYTTHSGYDMENAWVRTMVAGLESSGKDLEAVSEYVLGDKLKFTEMVLGKEVAHTKEIANFGMPNITTNRTEIYCSPELDFSSIDKDSIYYKRNCILPLFEIQNKLGNKEDVVGILKKGKCFYANYIADTYFNGKKFYEVPTNELEEFINLLHAQVAPNQHPSAIINILEYKNNAIDKLTEEEVKDNSFEILEGIAILYEKEIGLKAGDTLERVIQTAFKEETRKIEEGQPIEITKYKKDKIIDRYRNMFSTETENNMYINDYVEDFCFKCEQMDLEHKDEEVLITGAGIKIFSKQEGVIGEKERANYAVKSLQQSREKIIKEDTKEQKR